MSQNTTRPMNNPALRKMGMIVIVSVMLFVTFIITSTHPALNGNDGTVIFASILGAVVFTFYLMFAREIKQFKRELDI